MTMRHFCWIGASLVAVAMSAGSARADLIAGNFGPGDSFKGNSWTVGVDGSNYALAMPFTNSTGKAYVLDQFRFAANHFSGANQLLVDFYGGSSDLNGASVLESFTFTSPDAFAHVFTATSLVHPLILPGETYFIVLSEPPTPEARWGWQWNNQGHNGGYLVRIDSGSWSTDILDTPVFDVSGSVPAVAGVPEPSSLLLATLGLLSVITARAAQGLRKGKIAIAGNE